MKKSKAIDLFRTNGIKPNPLPAGTKLGKFFERNRNLEQKGALYFHGGDLTKGAFLKRYGEVGFAMKFGEKELARFKSEYKVKTRH